MPRIEGMKVGTDAVGRIVYSPIIIVSLLYGNVGLDIQAVVDSGADTTLIPAEVAAALGIQWAKLSAGAVGGGVGGRIEMRPVDLTMRYAGWKYTGPVMIAQPKGMPVVLLGRNDFFQSFVARFHWFKSPPEFHLDPANVGRH
jgi:hypothetical protein